MEGVGTGSFSGVKSPRLTFYSDSKSFVFQCSSKSCCFLFSQKGQSVGWPPTPWMQEEADIENKWMLLSLTLLWPDDLFCWSQVVAPPPCHTSHFEIRLSALSLFLSEPLKQFGAIVLKWLSVFEVFDILMWRHLLTIAHHGMHIDWKALWNGKALLCMFEI